MVLPALCASGVSIVFIYYLNSKLMKEPVGADLVKSHGIGHKLDFLSMQIKTGAKAFLAEEYKWLGYFVATLAIILLILFSVDYDDDADASQGVRTAAGFVFGAGLSATAGYLGMLVATDGNVRTTVACAGRDLNAGLQVAFNTGAIMGFTVVGLGLGGVSLAFLVLCSGFAYGPAMQVLAGFGFGASAIALFARVAGGIYTKAADVGADLVGKVEAGIDEDDPHNPAVIADNVGDNVGDVAGMGADLFESYVGSIIAAATLATTDAERALPFYLSAAGVICSLIGCFLVSTKEKGEGWNTDLGSLMFALEKGMYGAGILFVGFAALICGLLGTKDENLWKNFACIIIGLVAGMMIGKVTEYFTSFDFAPVKSIKDRGQTGPATVIIQGLGVGMLSCVPPVVILVAAILGCSAVNGNYGVAIAAVGMLATLGITLATDAYGPVADNAGGLAEMDPSIPEVVRGKTDALDALGNTTAATGKGFAIGSAVLTSLSLLAAFKEQANLKDEHLNVGDPVVLSGLLFGAMLPYMFAALTMISVGKAAAEIIGEVRRQFREVPGLKACIIKASNGETITEEEDVLPDSDRCVAISTRSSVREMVAPGLYAIVSPLFIGFLIGPRCLMGMLVGAIGSGAMVAIMMSNAGGAWDNGKKLCEKLKIKKTDQGKACIVGDTVGDPFKDTSGPALNILLKLMSMVSLTVAPLLQIKDDAKDDELDWNKWYFGLVPLAIFIIGTKLLMDYNILTWEDPLAQFLQPGDGGAGGGSEASQRIKLVELKRSSSVNITETKHNQTPDEHLDAVVPDPVPKGLAKRLSGHTFSEENFNKHSTDGGATISRKDYLENKHGL
jgi:inorganic pyrophosphatase